MEVGLNFKNMSCTDLEGI